LIRTRYTNETDILATLKLKVGGSETQTMESMLNDVTKVKAETVKWHAYVDKHKKNVALKASLKAFQPKVMSNSAWELPQMHIDLKCVPHRVEVWAEEYGKYYAVLQNSRHLTYRHDLSLVEISAKYGKRKYRINMSAPQACVLYLFNTNDKLTIPQIQNLLQVKESSSIQSILMTLLQKPLRNKSNGGLLLKIPVEGVKPLPLTNKDEFKTNSNFMCKLVKFDLRKPDYGYVKPKAPPPRNFRLEAALVRTMKTKKIMETKELIQDSTLLVAKFFKPDVREVKKTIEKLIKTEYIERVEGTTKLKYKA
jgi:cullin 1